MNKHIVDDDSDPNVFISTNKEANNENESEAFERLLKTPDKNPSKSPRTSMLSPSKESLTKSMKKRGINESWQSSVPKRNRNSLASRGGNLNVQCTPWGESISTFDLSDDYVNDYLKEKAAASG